MKGRLRTQTGQGGSVLLLIMAVLFLGLASFFSWELSRYLLARDQLKTVTEVAAITCETALASSGDASDATNQSNAENTAIQLFSQNSVLGRSLNGTLQVSDPTQLAPSPGQAEIAFQFLDPRDLQLAGGSTSGFPPGTAIRATSAYCYQSALGEFIGTGTATFTVQVSATSGLPRLDIVMAVDCSID